MIGPRQVGKTTLLKALVVEKSSMTPLWLNGDEFDVLEWFQNPTSTKLAQMLGSHELVIIDEAQRIQNIGLCVKLMVEHLPQKQIIVSGSSALELNQKIQESLTGRKFLCHLYPLSFEEMVTHTTLVEEKRLLEHRLIYGYYPEVVTHPGQEKELLNEICSSYLYKDLFMIDKIRKPALLEKLLQALALQIGQEVRYHELGRVLGVDTQTVERYIDFLEQTFVVYRLQSFSRNMRNEIKKGRKVYFYDLGIRNTIIKNFSPLGLRSDVGNLWENFLVTERLKACEYHKIPTNRFFWRTLQQQEIDYIEERDGKLFAHEFKWSQKSKFKIPQSFAAHYPDAVCDVITPLNVESFLLPQTTTKPRKSQ